MRKCIRCDVEMKEGLLIKVDGAANGIYLSEQKMFRGKIDDLRGAACPNCGYVELYINPINIKSLK